MHTRKMLWLFFVTVMSSTLVAQSASIGSYLPLTQSTVPVVRATSNPDGQRATTSPVPQTALIQGYGEVPLAFEPNQGQSVPGVRFVSRAKGLSVFLNDREVTLIAPSTSYGTPTVLRMSLPGSSTSEAPVAEDKQAGISNYLLGQQSQ